MKILIGTNVLTQLDSEAYGNHCGLWCYLGKKYPKDTLAFFHPRRLSIDNMRNEAARIALEEEFEYLMFIDDDVLIQPNVLDFLLEADKDIVAAVTHIRSYPFRSMFFKYVGENLLSHYDDYEKDVDEKGLLKCDAVGFSCVLIKVELLKKLTKPFFITGAFHTEDVYFCVKAQKELGLENVSIYVDTRCPTAHLLDKEAVSSKNVKALREYYKTAYPDLGKEDRTYEQSLLMRESFK